MVSKRSRSELNESTQQSFTLQRSALEASLWELTAQGLPQYDNIKDTIAEIEATNSLAVAVYYIGRESGISVNALSDR